MRESVSSTLAEVREFLDRPPGERPPGLADWGDRLCALTGELRDSVMDDGALPPSEIADRIELIYEVGEVREALRERGLIERLEVLARIQESMFELRTCETPQELIEAAPGELCRACGFTRALISRVHGGKWVPEVIETVSGMDPEASEFAKYIDEVEIPLDHMLIETELVRRRTHTIVRDPQNDPRTYKPIMQRGRTDAYVAAPIMPTGRVIGFLHADRIGQPYPVDDQDRENIWTFAEQFGLLYERAVLVERLGSQREQMREAFASAEKVIDDLWQAEIELTRREQEEPEVSRTAASLFRSSDSRLDRLMTRREREVLELMSSGATNTRIAQELVISEGTVKSHVKHILRKLRVGNRAEAVARYLQLLMREQELGRR